ncbi:MAG: MFS transporter [Actinobacteria bacterium]|nr:MFS transporter [Actinomycetota bacterium]
MATRVEIVEANLDRLLAELAPGHAALPDDAPLIGTTGLTAARARELFSDQVRSRALDVAARRLKADGRGYYTISSAGHEANALVGAATRATDPAFLHYRSGAFVLARARKVPGVDAVADTIRSLVVSAQDPISRGRHKVWGSRELWIPPQTSTIGSHPPKAVGAAVALTRADRVEREIPLPEDSIVVCSFGDASANHATTLAAVNAARYAHRRGNPVPILFVCEDNGIGISVETPRGWIRDTFQGTPHLRYAYAGGELDEVWDAVAGAVDLCRDRRVPVFLHLPVVRLLGHAGSDVETTYRTVERIEAEEARDPLLATARRLVATGAATPAQLRGLVEDARAEVERAVLAHADEPPLRTYAEVVAPIAPHDPDRVRAAASGTVPEPERRAHFGGELPEETRAATRRTMAAAINAALHDEMLRRPETMLFGEDVATKGGVYHVTAGLQAAFGQGRVFDTLLDETTILGLAQGAGMLGFLPIPEIQYLAYVHNALDQLRGEACSLAFFSDGQFTNPMVVRIASFAYQKGFGGHFHNDDAIGALRDIPGLVLAAPARGDDAARMLRGALAMAAEHGRVVAFLEPIALYHEKDLHEPGDGGWLTDYPPPGEALLPGEVATYGDGGDVLIVSYANGLRMSLRAARRLTDDHGVRATVLDLRWLNPLPLDAVREHAARCAAVLVADECRATGGGIADAVVADLARAGTGGRLGSVCSRDSYVPLGPAADTVLLSEDDIVSGVLALR